MAVALLKAGVDERDDPTQKRCENASEIRPDYSSSK